jgi:hypothetical protein
MMLQMSSRNVRLILLTIVVRSRGSAVFGFGVFDFFFMAQCILVQPQRRRARNCFWEIIHHDGSPRL